MSSRAHFVGVALGLIVLSTPVHGDLTVIEARKVITVTGEEYSPGMVVIEDGEITLVGANLEVPAGAKRIRARGETVMPGMILARTRQGLSSGAAPAPPPRFGPGRRFGPRPTRSRGRSGVHCDAKALDEIHPGEIDHRPFLRAGYIAAAYVPSGTGFPGQAGVIGFGDEETVRVLKGGAYLPVTFTSNSRDRGTVKSAFDNARKEIEKAKKAKEEWDKKQAEAKKKADAEAKKAAADKDAAAAGKAPPKDGGKPAAEKPKEPAKFVPPKIPPALEPLVHILEKKKTVMPLVFQIGGAGNYRHLEKALEELEEVDGDERHRNVQMLPSSSTEQRAIIEALGERKATVITTPRLANLPQTRTKWNLPAELTRAGCKVVFIPSSDSETEFRRVLGRVADLVRSGLSRKAGLEALTVNPARFLGLGERNGAIEKGRAADLIFLDGDPFAAATEVTRTMIGGEIVWERETE